MASERYVELHAHSAFSFLDGASLPEELAFAAAELGHEAIALTDHDGLWGSMELAQACRSLGLRAITGVELTVAAPSSPRPSEPLRGNCPPGCFHLTLLVEDVRGYRNLCRLLTHAHARTRAWAGGGGDRAAGAYELIPPALPFERLAEHTEGLVCLTGCARDGAVAGRLRRGDAAGAEAIARRLLAIFGPDRLRVELQRPLWRGDRARNRRLAELADLLGIPAVATGNVHMHRRHRAALQDALVAIRLRGTLESTETERRGNGGGFLADPERMAQRFADHPDAVAETARLAERLRFDLTRDLGYRYPGSENPHADRELAETCRAAFGERYGSSRRRAEAEGRLTEELRVIGGLGLSGFFLLHRDLLELAREVAVEVRGPSAARALLPPGRGRGSSVSSIVCYLTGLSHVDPVESGLFLGRFLNDEITEAPDIDLDFPRDVREKLIPRVHERYGDERSALVAAFPTYRSRGAVRDLGLALGLPAGEIERVARSVDVYGTLGDPGAPGRGAEEVPGVSARVAEAIGPERARSGRWRTLIALAREIGGLPRHASQHPGGMVLSTRPLIDLCPVVPAAMEGRRIAQWDKDSCADAGFLKIDLLGLGMLSAVERAVDEIARARGEHIDLSRIPLDDAEVYTAIQGAETTGVFQIESRAQMQMLPRSRPETIEDLTVQVALVRPGPIQGGAVHPYLEGRKRLREDPDWQVPYEHPSLEPILADTLGAIVFQDQVIQVAMELAGFTAGEAEGLRRAMSRKRSEEAMVAYRERFISGAISRGVEPAVAERVFEQVRGFSGFGFPKSHAVAFGLLAYQSTWLRVHYAPELLCGLLNEQPMGFYPPDALVHEAQRRGIEVLGPHVNESDVLCRTERTAGSGPVGDGELAVRIGLGYVNGLAGTDAEAVFDERERRGPYRDLGDLASRSGASRDGLGRLAWAEACSGLAGELSAAGSRREDLWTLGTAAGTVRRGAHEQMPLPLPLPDAPALAAQTPWERVRSEYTSLGMSLGEHPMALLRAGLDPAVVPAVALAGLPDGAELEIAGMTVARQRPETASGVVFLLLEDESGVTNVIVPPPVYERCRLAVRTATLVTVGGRLERRQGVTNVLASSVRELDRPDRPLAAVHDLDRRRSEDAAEPIADLGAVLPAANSFGRRGR
jgi:error-prone DNA polymerase